MSTSGNTPTSELCPTSIQSVCAEKHVVVDVGDLM